MGSRGVHVAGEDLAQVLAVHVGHNAGSDLAALLVDQGHHRRLVSEALLASDALVGVAVLRLATHPRLIGHDGPRQERRQWFPVTASRSRWPRNQAVW